MSDTAFEDDPIKEYYTLDEFLYMFENRDSLGAKIKMRSVVSPSEKSESSSTSLSRLTLSDLEDDIELPPPKMDEDGQVEEDEYLVTLTPQQQKEFRCELYKYLSIENPWTTVHRNKILNHINTHKTHSPFYPCQKRLRKYRFAEVLIGFDPSKTRRYDQFVVLLNAYARTVVLNDLKENKLKLTDQATMRNIMVPRPWESLGSEAEIHDETVYNNRPLIQVEWTGQKLQRFHADLNFQVRHPIKDNKSYTCIVPQPDFVPFVRKNLIDQPTQAIAGSVSKIVQTVAEIPTNASTQYNPEEDMSDLKCLSTIIGEIPDVLPLMDKYLPMITSTLKYNERYDLYKDDYQKLAQEAVPLGITPVSNYRHFDSFSVALDMRGKFVVDTAWHPKLSGVVAVAYSNTKLGRTSLVDEEEPKKYPPSFYENKRLANEQVAFAKAWISRVKNMAQDGPVMNQNMTEWNKAVNTVKFANACLQIRNRLIERWITNEDLIPEFEELVDLEPAVYVSYDEVREKILSVRKALIKKAESYPEAEDILNKLSKVSEEGYRVDDSLEPEFEKLKAIVGEVVVEAPPPPVNLDDVSGEVTPSEEVMSIAEGSAQSISPEGGEGGEGEAMSLEARSFGEGEGERSEIAPEGREGSLGLEGEGEAEGAPEGEGEGEEGDELGADSRKDTASKFARPSFMKGISRIPATVVLPTRKSKDQLESMLKTFWGPGIMNNFGPLIQKVAYDMTEKFIDATFRELGKLPDSAMHPHPRTQTDAAKKSTKPAPKKKLSSKELDERRKIVKILGIDTAPEDLEFLDEKTESEDSEIDFYMGRPPPDNPVLIWTFVNSLVPVVCLESPYPVNKITFCPHNGDILVGGCQTGQLVVWDLKGKIEKAVRNVQMKSVVARLREGERDPDFRSAEILSSSSEDEADDPKDTKAQSQQFESKQQPSDQSVPDDQSDAQPPDLSFLWIKHDQSTDEYRARKYVERLIRWQKDIKKIKMSQITAVSLQKDSHLSPIIELNWVYPMHEINETGHVAELDENHKYSMQIMSVSSGGWILVWDLANPEKRNVMELTRPDLTFVRPNKFERSEAVKKTYSKFKGLDKQMCPYYRISLSVNGKNTLMSTVSFSPISYHFEKKGTYPPGFRPDMKDAIKYKFVPKECEPSMDAVFGTAQGNVGYFSWSGLSLEAVSKGKDIPTEEVSAVLFAPIHDGPISKISRHPLFPEVILSTGGHVFAIWHLSNPHWPIKWHKYQAITVTSCSWSTSRPTLFRIARSDGAVEAWDLVLQSHAPEQTVVSSGQPVTVLSNNLLPLPKSIIGIGDLSCDLRFFYVPWTSQRCDSSEIEAIKDMLFNEVIRKQGLRQWSQDWKATHLQKGQKLRVGLQTEVKAVVQQVKSIVSKEITTCVKYKEEIYRWYMRRRGSQTVFMDEKERRWFDNEMAHMRQTILNNKRWDQKKVDSLLQPLIKKEEQERRLEVRIKEMLALTDEIFRENVSALLKESRPRVVESKESIQIKADIEARTKAALQELELFFGKDHEKFEDVKQAQVDELPDEEELEIDELVELYNALRLANNDIRRFYDPKYKWLRNKLEKEARESGLEVQENKTHAEKYFEFRKYHRRLANIQYYRDLYQDYDPYWDIGQIHPKFPFKLKPGVKEPESPGLEDGYNISEELRDLMTKEEEQFKFLIPDGSDPSLDLDALAAGIGFTDESTLEGTEGMGDYERPVDKESTPPLPQVIEAFENLTSYLPIDDEGAQYISETVREELKEFELSPQSSESELVIVRKKKAVETDSMLFDSLDLDDKGEGEGEGEGESEIKSESKDESEGELEEVDGGEGYAEGALEGYEGDQEVAEGEVVPEPDGDQAVEKPSEEGIKSQVSEQEPSAGSLARRKYRDLDDEDEMEGVEQAEALEAEEEEVEEEEEAEESSDESSASSEGICDMLGCIAARREPPPDQPVAKKVADDAEREPEGYHGDTDDEDKKSPENK